jgi:DNA-binding response OmpR family regulator
MCKKKILIVDDEKAVRTAMAMALDSVHYQIDVAENGIQAIGYLDKISYDLIITDCSMPEMDGLELIQIINSRYPTLPVLMVTGSKSTRDILRDRNTSYFPKPFQIPELKNRVEDILNRKISNT